MKYSVYNQEGKEIGQTLLPKEIFEISLNSDLVHQVTVSQMANRRRVISKAKERGEVRGGGRKPWRQKGTGRARAGSIRSPLWRGGGTTFGPVKERVFTKKIPKKMRRKALFMALSAKARDNSLLILDKIEIKKPKTREIAEILEKLKLQSSSILLALPAKNDELIRASRNIPNIQLILAKSLNCLDLLSFKYLVMPKETIKIIKETFINKQ